MTESADHQKQSFIWKYVFSRDHKVHWDTISFFDAHLVCFRRCVGDCPSYSVSLAMDKHALFWQRTFRNRRRTDFRPIFNNMLFTMHASIMIFFVIIPILAGAFGNILIPLMIGADDMAFPTLNMLSYWVMWPAFIFMGLSFATPTFGPAFGWTANPPMAAGPALTYWAVRFNMRWDQFDDGLGQLFDNHHSDACPGYDDVSLANDHLGNVCHPQFYKHFALPVLTAALCMQLADNAFGTGFFRPESAASSGWWRAPDVATFILVLFTTRPSTS